jgi:hypothetical protein
MRWFAPCLISMLILGCASRATLTPGDDDTVAGDDDASADDDTVSDDDDDDDATADDDSGDDDTTGSGAAAALVASLDQADYTGTLETLAGFGDRSQGSDSYAAAEDWLASELQAMGYSVERHGFEYYGSPRDNLIATKVGTVHPDQMVIVSAHLDGRGGGGAADDDGSGSSLVLEAARAFAPADVTVEISVRFVWWNCEETGLNGSSAYVEDRAPLQGIEDPEGSGEYPEPSWVGMIQSDMILFDHGLPPGEDQAPDADIDVEYQASATFAAEGQALAQQLADGCVTHCADYPAEVGPEMSNTDSYPFRNHTAAVSVRENRRLDEIGAGSNPHWHQPTDVLDTYSSDDLRLGFNATQMVVGTVAELVGASVAE